MAGADLDNEKQVSISCVKLKAEAIALLGGDGYEPGPSCRPQ